MLKSITEITNSFQLSGTEKSGWELAITLIVGVVWPVLILIIVLIFKDQIQHVLQKLKKLRVGNNEIQVQEEVKEFQEITLEAHKNSVEDFSTVEGTVNELEDLDITKADPQTNIIVLGKKIEKELKEIIASMGLLDSKSYLNFQQAFEVLEKWGAIPKQIMISVKIFSDLRNKIIYDNGSDHSAEAIRVLDIGVILLQSIRSIPHESNVVYLSGIDLFSDAACTQMLSDVKGLILKTISPGGIVESFKIFPTTNPSYYIVGRKVAWEWDLSKSWEKTWYIEPNTKEKKVAWHSAGEFVGRHLEEIK